MMRLKGIYISVVWICLLLMVGCTEKYPNKTDEAPGITSGGCELCHLDAEMLKAVAIPNPPDTGGDSGEG